MKDNGEIDRIIKHFLPSSSIILTEKNNDSVPLVINDDIDSDGSEELAALYKDIGNRLVGVKKNDGRWANAWYVELPSGKIESMKYINKNILININKNSKIKVVLIRWIGTGPTIIDETRWEYEHIDEECYEDEAVIIGWKKNDKGQIAMEIFEAMKDGIHRVLEKEDRYLIYIKAYRKQLRKKVAHNMHERDTKKILQLQNIRLFDQETEVMLVGYEDMGAIEEINLIIGSTKHTEEMQWRTGCDEAENVEMTVGTFSDTQSQDIFLKMISKKDNIEKCWLLKVTPDGIIDMLDNNENIYRYLDKEIKIKDNGHWFLFSPDMEEKLILCKEYKAEKKQGFLGKLIYEFKICDKEIKINNIYWMEQYK